MTIHFQTLCVPEQVFQPFIAVTRVIQPAASYIYWNVFLQLLPIALKQLT